MEALMDRSVIAEITSHFKALSSIIPLHTISSERDYDKAVTTLNQLLDAGAANEKHPLADLVNTLGALIGEYDNDHYPEQDVSPLAMLRFLMDQNHLTQTNLPEIGTQGVVSEILSGKRELNVRQIKALGERFHVPPSVFV
ncbi:MAG: transcriptional regulator [Undibacterium sp.]|uniref:helix-turn-helix domain-containing protein n=1 Tax=Undibacterium sp. TaxID=1914977 RepID=UPI0027209F1F|nr:transcriptional regulator [Undibacterium sp.]MDO8651893.1 transcriptional regulator [Undibacterium sp.]